MMPRHPWLKATIGVVGVLLVGLAAFDYWCAFCTAPIHLSLSGGDACPLRSEMAHCICHDVTEAGITLDPKREVNSETICTAVDKGDLDLGLVLGGFPSGSHPNVRQVATFGVEPLHLLVRPELLQGKQPTLEILRGRIVSLGEAGTNGSLLAESLMQFAGLRPTTTTAAGDYRAAHLRDKDLYTALRAVVSASPESRAAFAGVLPDAVFVVDNLPVPIVDQLVHVGGYQLVPLPYATAMHLDSRRNHGAGEDQLENSRLEAVTIPACTYGINPPVPAADCPSFGLRLMLVANKDVPATSILRLLEALDAGVIDKYHVDLTVADENSEFTTHPGAAAFAKGRKPFAMGAVFERLKSIMSMVGAGGAGVFAVWGFLRGLKAVHPDVYLRKIDQIERLVRGDEQELNAPALPHELIDFLEARLVAVKQAAIDDYARRRLQGDEAFVGILTLVADARHLLAQRRDQLARAELCLPEVRPRLANAA
jgi:TRAP-type uncharacterized transport system substrate-binding protein